jgi:hypothetical protein
MDWLFEKEYKDGLAKAIQPHQEEINRLTESKNPADREQLFGYMAYISDYAKVQKDNAVAQAGYAMAQGFAQGQAGPAPEPLSYPVVEDYLYGGSKNESAVNAGVFAALKDKITYDIIAENIKYYEQSQPGFLGSIVEGATFIDWWSGTAKKDFAKKLDVYLNSLPPEDMELIEETGGGLELTKQGIIANFDRIKPEQFQKLRYEMDADYRSQKDAELQAMEAGAFAMATGGIATSETRATIGEAGMEAVLPLQGRYARDSASLIGQGLLQPLVEWASNNLSADLYQASSTPSSMPPIVIADNRRSNNTTIAGGGGGGGVRPEFNSGPTVMGFEEVFANMIALYQKGAKV